jgi:hypothetical protein
MSSTKPINDSFINDRAVLNFLDQQASVTVENIQENIDRAVQMADALPALSSAERAVARRDISRRCLEIGIQLARLGLCRSSANQGAAPVGVAEGAAVTLGGLCGHLFTLVCASTAISRSRSAALRMFYASVIMHMRPVWSSFEEKNPHLFQCTALEGTLTYASFRVRSSSLYELMVDSNASTAAYKAVCEAKKKNIKKGRKKRVATRTVAVADKNDGAEGDILQQLKTDIPQVPADSLRTMSIDTALSSMRFGVQSLEQIVDLLNTKDWNDVRAAQKQISLIVNHLAASYNLTAAPT